MELGQLLCCVRESRLASYTKLQAPPTISRYPSQMLSYILRLKVVIENQSPVLQDSLHSRCFNYDSYMVSLQLLHDKSFMICTQQHTHSNNYFKCRKQQ